MFDFHTHHPNAPAGQAIINLPRTCLLHPERFHPTEGGLYSAGIHPWWTDYRDELERMRDGLAVLARHPQVVRLGECGYDRLRGVQHLQAKVFGWHIKLSEELRKPLTIHCVRAFDLLLADRKRWRPTQRWAVHGFRGKPSLAMQLLAAGFDLSYGPRRNETSFAITPPERRFTETDAEMPAEEERPD